MTESGRALAIEKDGLVLFPRNNFGVALTISEHHESGVFSHTPKPVTQTRITRYSASASALEQLFEGSPMTNDASIV